MVTPTQSALARRLEHARQHHAAVVRRMSEERPRGAPIIIDGEWRAVRSLLDPFRVRARDVHGAVGIGLGRRRVANKLTDERALIVFVKDKLPEEELTARRVQPLPRFISVAGKDLRIDVVPIGRMRLQSKGGDSLGPQADMTEATLGVMAVDTASHRPVAITAMHATEQVECPSDTATMVSPSNARAGAQILGELIRGTRRGIDAAKIALDPAIVPSFELGGLGVVAGWRRISVTNDQDKSIRVYGFTSGLLLGTIREPLITIEDDQMSLNPGVLVEVNTKPGDSGAVMVDENLRVLGTLVGIPEKYPDRRAFSPIGQVLSVLECDIPPGEATQ